MTHSQVLQLQTDQHFLFALLGVSCVMLLWCLLFTVVCYVVIGLFSVVLTVVISFINTLGVIFLPHPVWLFWHSSQRRTAAKALMRLQDTYQLDTNTISTGELPGSSSVASLTVDDCFDLGKVAYSEADYYHTELWMAQALKQLDQGETPGLMDTVTILEYLSYSIYQQGEVERALNFTKRLLELDPTHQRANMNLKHYEYLLSEQKVEAMEEDERRQKRESRGQTDDLLKYEQLCRGEGTGMSEFVSPKNVCILLQTFNVFFVQIYVSFTEISEKGRFLLYHRLRRATVHDPQTGKLTTAHYRVSKSAWLKAYEHPVLDKINQRIGDITGLDVTTAEDLQVANYGIGGQYEPHFDFGQKGELYAFEESGTGNRIATWLFYMSDVPAGGATVFTKVGVTVWPIKGTAVFWYNLYPSGEGDYQTRHAACPVLVGSKWVSNKWIRERGQEFRRRCGLQETD
uniref:procollagen-proline 4-dioxygenase n=1 Tax=Acanthochromis polyacanthus TaxID=80966 RepID=A0A3Q1H8T8_9TELE